MCCGGMGKRHSHLIVILLQYYRNTGLIDEEHALMQQRVKSLMMCGMSAEPQLAIVFKMQVKMCHFVKLYQPRCSHILKAIDSISFIDISFKKITHSSALTVS